MNIFNINEKVLTPDGEGRVKDWFHYDCDRDKDIALVSVDFGDHYETYLPYEVIVIREDFRCDVGQNLGHIAPNNNHLFQTQNSK